MVQEFSIVEIFIRTARRALDEGLISSARDLLSGEWLEADANAQQKEAIVALKARLKDCMAIELEYGNGALIEPDSDLGRYLLSGGIHKVGLLDAMERYRIGLSGQSCC